MLNSLPTLTLARVRWDNSLTRGRFGFCVVQSVIGLGGSPPVAFARTDHVGRPIARRHPLTLIVLTTARAAFAVRASS